MSYLCYNYYGGIMKIIEITNNERYLREYIKICKITWGKKCDDIDDYVNKRIINILNTNNNKIITVLGLIDDNSILIGFISLFKYDGDERFDLTPWYATMYIKEEYRNKHLSKILNDAILEKAKNLGFKKVYLKSELVNYYEKFGFKYIETLNNGEKLYYIEL